jgi:hypothetical protein
MIDSDSDDDVLFEIWNKQTQLFISAAVAATSSHELVDAAGQQSVNGSERVRDVLARLVATPVIFRRLTNFSVDEFYELCNKLGPVLDMTARFTGDIIKKPDARLSYLRNGAFLTLLRTWNTTILYISKRFNGIGRKARLATTFFLCAP